MIDTQLANIQIQFTKKELLHGLPLLWITGLALFVLIVDLVLRKRSSKRYLGWITVFGLIAGMVFNQLSFPVGGDLSLFHDAFQVDAYTYYANWIILFSVLISTLSSLDYLYRSNLLQGEFYGLLLLGTSGMMMMVGAADLIIFFLGFEIMSISAYILVGWSKSDLRSGEGSLKYVVTGAFTSAILVYGIILLMASAGTVSLAGITPDFNDPLFMIGFALVTGSFAFKIAAVPFHMWAPDAYRGAPSPVTGFISTGVKVAAIIGFLRLFLEILSLEQMGASGTSRIVPVFAAAAGLSVIIGNVAAIAYRDIKGMLAYSSIAHAGYVLIGITAMFSTGSGLIRHQTGGAVLFYLFAYTFMNLGAFGCVIYAGNGDEERLNLSDYRGLAHEHPWLASAFGLFLLSLTGIPLTAGFSGKVLIFQAALEADFLWLALIGAGGTLISIYYYMRVVVMMFMREPEDPFQLSFSPSLTLMLSVTACGVLGLGMMPRKLITLSRRTMDLFT